MFSDSLRRSLTQRSCRIGGIFSSISSVSDFRCSETPRFVAMEVDPGQFAKDFHSSNEKSRTGDDCCSINVQSTPEIEKKFVHHVYDAIAPHFSATRFAKWPKVAAFLSNLSPGSVVLDAGCGNGKYLGFNPECFFIGCDISPPLIGICAGKDQEVLVADAVNLPYRDGFGDAAISIAVLHHLSTESRRRKAVEELIRVVKKGGLVLITVWAVEQEDGSLVTKWTPLSIKYEEEWISSSSPVPPRLSSETSLESIPEIEDDGSLRDRDKPKSGMDVDFSGQDEKNSGDGKIGKNQQEYFVPWHLPYHRTEANASADALATGFARKDDKKGALVFDRYYHVFAEGELQRYYIIIFNLEVFLFLLRLSIYHFCLVFLFVPLNSSSYEVFH